MSELTAARAAVALGLLHGPAELSRSPPPGTRRSCRGCAAGDWETLDPAARKRFEVALHAGVAAALAVIARRELGAAYGGRRLACVVLPAVAPAALAGAPRGRPIERRLGTPATIAAGLPAAASRWRSPSASGGHERRLEDAGVADGLALGLAQAVALVPGVSRSGAARAVARAARLCAREAPAALRRAVGLPDHARRSRAAKHARLPGRRAARVAHAWPPAAFASTLASGGAAARVRGAFALPLRRLPHRARGGRGPPPARESRRDDRRLRRAPASTRARPTAVFAAIVDVLRAIDARSAVALAPAPAATTRACSRSRRGSGVALSTDGVGSKLILAEQPGQLDDGRDRLRRDERQRRRLRRRRADRDARLHRRRARRRRGARAGRDRPQRAAPSSPESRSPAASSRCSPSMIRGHPSPGGLELSGTAIGTVALDASSPASAARPGTC